MFQGKLHTEKIHPINFIVVAFIVKKRWCVARGGTPLFGLYGDVPLDRVWFFGLAVLNRVYHLTCLCPNMVSCHKQGVVFRARDLNPDYKQSLSFLSRREIRRKEHAIERRTTSGAFLFLVFL